MFFGIFGILIFIIGLGTAFVYTKGLHLAGTARYTLLILGAIMPLLFVGTFALGRTLPANALSNTLYTVVMAVSGIIFYLFLGAIILGVLLLGSYILKTSLPLWVSWVMLSISIGLGVFGIIQARTVRIVEYTVTLPGAPISWNTKTAVLVSDTHYGQVNREKFARRVVNKIRELNPDFVLHAGDFYDGIALDTTGISFEWKQLTAQIPVFYAPGNHEEYGPYAEFITSIKNAGIIVLADAKADYGGVTIAGVTYHDAAVAEQFEKTLSSLTLGTPPSILINHAPVHQSVAQSAGIDLMVSGHTHNGQFWPNTYVSQMVYKAFGHGLAHFEDMTTITTSGIGTWGPPLRTFNTPEIVVIHFKTE